MSSNSAKKTQLIACQYGWILCELCYYVLMDRDGAEVYIHAQNELINVAVNWYIFYYCAGSWGRDIITLHQ